MRLSRTAKAALALAVVAGLVWANNTTLFSRPDTEKAVRLLAHRGQHQTYNRDGLQNDTCTATRINPPEHGFIENTIASMRAAFEAGAEVVELDVHLTPDRQFAVFHDWTLDCRTDGQGVTEETPMAVLKTLDVGYGYTADGGKTFPFRGKGVGLMPTLEEVFQAFPQGRFLVNFKSRRAEEGQALADLVNTNPAYRRALWGVYGGSEPTLAALEAIPGLRGFDRGSVKACLLSYLGMGWTGYVPAPCRNTIVPVPVNWAPALWGWPYRLTERMKAHGSEVILMGPYEPGELGTSGIDTEIDRGRVPKGFDGLVWTNRIEDAALHNLPPAVN